MVADLLRLLRWSWLLANCMLLLLLVRLLDHREPLRLLLQLAERSAQLPLEINDLLLVSLQITFLLLELLIRDLQLNIKATDDVVLLFELRLLLYVRLPQ